MSPPRYKDPLELIKKSLKKANRRRLKLPHAMALASLDKQGRPTCRMMLLKGTDERGFVFYTNLKSRKALGLRARPQAALLFWWAELDEQIRVEGGIEEISKEEADAYFATRPRGSQIGAWASLQSHPLPSRNRLLQAFKKYAKRFRNTVPRPPFWSGYRVIPKRIEFWKSRPDRLHERVLYERSKKRWTRKLLYP